MRSDLTPAFIAAKDADFRRPRQLLVLHFSSGPVYLSDQAITLGGHDYLPLVEEWGRLDTAGDSDEATGEIRQMTITLWNGGTHPFSDRFLLESPENVEVELYQWFAGLADSDKALIDRFVIQDPINYGEASRLVTLDLVSLGMRYDGPIGDLLTKDAWPYALDSDVNKGIPLIVGSPGQVQTICGRTAPAATMTGSILLLPTIVNVHEDLDELGFPTSGKIQIDEEIMEFSGRDNDTFTVSVRGVDGTKAAEHSDGATVIQHITDHTYIVAQPLSAIDDVRVGGLPAHAGTYTVHPTDNPATIIFSQKPSFIQYSKGARDTLLDFDAATAANNAFQPHYAYLEEEKSKGALVSKDYTPLALIQTDPAADDGEVVRAFLSVEHWATDQYLNDEVEVWVDGLGVVGKLSKPNADDVASFSADVDVDHSHTHKTGGDHTHSSTDPDFSSVSPEHLHSLSSGEQSEVGSVPTSTYNNSRTIYYGPDKGSAHTRTLVEFRITRGGYRVISGVSYYSYVEIAGVRAYANHTYTSYFAWITDSNSFYASINTQGSSVPVEYNIIGVTVYYGDTLTSNVAASVSTTKSAPGSVTGLAQGTSVIKDSGDVNPLATANRQLENIVTSTSSHAVTNIFDLTKLLETISWDWFTGREIQIRYVGTANTAKIIVTYVSFQVEYRQRETILSDDVTCAPVGLIGNRPDQVIEYLLNAKAGLPLASLDGTAAGTRFTELGYQLDGVLPATMTIRAAIKTICMQARSRLIWAGGVAKLAVREKMENWNSVKSLLPDDLQQKSIRVHRQPVSAIVNDIHLFYQKDYSLESDDQSAYLSTASNTDQLSINKHGIKRDDARFTFDLVRDQAMAESLADFYIWLLGEPSTFYEFTGYLPQFDLEKEDVVHVTSQGFSQIVRLPMVIRGADRIFGSGKNQAINLYCILAESIRHRIIEMTTEDIITLTDDLTTEKDSENSTADPMIFADILISMIETGTTDQMTLSDELITIFNVVHATDDGLSITDVVSSEIVMTTEDQIVLTDELADATDGMAIIDECITDSGFGSLLGDGWGVIPFGSPK